MNLLPGCSPAALLAAGAPLITQIATATAEGNVVCPSVQAGDLIAHLDLAFTIGSIPASVVPSGFSSRSDISLAGGARQIISVKTAVGNEGGTTLTGMSGGLSNHRVVATFRRSPSSSGASFSIATGQATSGNPTLQTVTASDDPLPLIVLGCYGCASAGTVSPRTMSPAKDGEIGNSGNNLFLAWKIYNESPANVDIDMDDESDANFLQSLRVTMT
jgi:hypothetical protein